MGLLSLTRDDVDYLVETCRQAGAVVMEVYHTDIEAWRKQDGSPVTEADLRSDRLISARLRQRFPGVPVLSEETVEETPYELRRHWSEFWTVDPLDGTKEFLKRNGQFTINIALIQHGRPTAGLVYAPAKDLLYCAAGEYAFRREGDAAPRPFPPLQPASRTTLRVVGSLSHPSPEMKRFLAEQRHSYEQVEFVAMGSSLKICLVAEGRADIYPRFGPTMEWDTAAAHAIANRAGRRVLRYGSDEELRYNKPDLHNPWFVVC